MPTHYKILGQVTPAATTSTDLYTVPSLTETIISTIVVCNANGAPVFYRLSVAIAGAVLANQQYIAFDQQLPANSSRTFTLGVTLAATDKIRCYGSTTLVIFNVFGAEIS